MSAVIYRSLYYWVNEMNTINIDSSAKLDVLVMSMYRQWSDGPKILVSSQSEVIERLSWLEIPVDKIRFVAEVSDVLSLACSNEFKTLPTVILIDSADNIIKVSKIPDEWYSNIHCVDAEPWL